MGSSLNLPYYHVISQNKDFTFRPTIFDSDIKMFQNEFRIKNKNSSAIVDFAYVDGYQSSLSNKKNSLSHIFAKFDADWHGKILIKVTYSYLLKKCQMIHI